MERRIFVYIDLAGKAHLVGTLWARAETRRLRKIDYLLGGLSDSEIDALKADGVI